MKKYSRVTYGIRCQIDALLQAHFSIPRIAATLGFHKTTIYRELKRNAQLGRYTPGSANLFSRQRYAKCRRPFVLKPAVEGYVIEKLANDWSPEQVAGRFRYECGGTLSHQTIYNHINFKERGLKIFLRKNGRRGCGRYIQRAASKTKWGYNIAERSSSANNRERIGDWERDTMHTLNAVQLLVCCDRKSRFVKIGRIEQRTSVEAGKLTRKLLESTGKKVHTITNDNGGDFKAFHDPGARVYFCDPRKPQQRGTIENSIGLLRQYVGRKDSISGHTENDFKALEEKLNFRPRKVLDYKTPHEVYYDRKVALAVLI